MEGEHVGDLTFFTTITVISGRRSPGRRLQFPMREEQPGLEPLLRRQGQQHVKGIVFGW